ncbi:MAG: outer membrane beta-barrel protein [Parachlamydiales bacterium]|nr:outer membrane beta-barrel protein [Parachlamydiales bacterium]
MNKRRELYWIFLGVFLAVLFTHHEARAQQTNVPIKENKYNSFKTIWEIKPSYFHFQDNTFRDILGSGHGMFSVEIDWLICHFLALFAEAGYLYTKGHTLQEQIPTSLQVVPLSLGLKGIFSMNSLAGLYAKIGPNWLYLKEHSDYSYFQHNVDKNTFGVTAGVGLFLHIAEHMCLDFFSNYLYGKKHYIDRYSNTRIKRYFGGFQFGIGFAFAY